jgi:UDP-3-O-[3-hydroxymyristoyl] glucosamine N-acyltransferase
MADPRFFTNHGPFSLGQIADIAQAKLAQGADPELQIRDVAPLDLAAGDAVSFIDNPIYLADFANSAAGACVVSPAHRDRAPEGMALIISDQPYLAYARIAAAFYPYTVQGDGIAESAIIDKSAILGDRVAIGHGTVIAANVEIGAGAILGANVSVGPAVVIGEGCKILDNVTLSHCLIGDGVTLHPGVRVGQDGFGFVPDPSGYVKVPQVGRVVIGDNCEVGANSTIDRGANRDTIIADGCWIDNLVQIGHNVELGQGCIIVAQVGISGSTKLSDFVAVGGQTGIAGHIKIGAGAKIAAMSGIMSDVSAGATMAGIPAMPFKQFFRQVAVLKRLALERGKKT